MPDFADVGEHPFSEYVVYACLISFAWFLKLSDNVSIKAQRHCLFNRTIEAAPNSVFPCARWKLWNVRRVNLVIGQSGDGRQFSLLFGRDPFFGCRLGASDFSSVVHRYSVPAVLLFALR